MLLEATGADPQSAVLLENTSSGGHVPTERQATPDALSLRVRGQRLERIRSLEPPGHITDTIRGVDEIEFLGLCTLAEVQSIQLDPADVVLVSKGGS